MKSKPRYKDKVGNNVKQHFGIFKYFINTTNQEKDKFYISRECRKIPSNISLRVSKQEDENMQKYGMYYYQDRVKRLGYALKHSKPNEKIDATSLEYWGLPAGICE